MRGGARSETVHFGMGKPGMKYIDVCETLENSAEIDRRARLEAGVAF